MTYTDIEKKFKKWLVFNDMGALKVLLATVVVNLYPGDPLWLFLVAPPSSLKTELINSLSGLPSIHPLSSLTPQTLVSGFKSLKDVSLLPRLGGKILALKDFTSVLTMHRDKRTEIIGQLREIYDGKYNKSFGTGKTVDWKGKVGLVAGVTPIVDSYYSVHQVLGERFIQCRLSPEDPIASAKAAMGNNGSEKQMREELSANVASFVGEVQGHYKTIDIDTEYSKDRTAHLATLCAIARSGIPRQGYTWEISYVPDPEGPGRLAKQFQMLGVGLAVVNDSSFVGLEEYNLVFRVGMDTLPVARRKMIEALAKNNDYVGIQNSADEMRYPYTTVRTQLEDLQCLGLVRKSDKSEGWILTDTAKEHLCISSPEKS